MTDQKLKLGDAMNPQGYSRDPYGEHLFEAKMPTIDSTAEDLGHPPRPSTPGSVDLAAQGPSAHFGDIYLARPDLDSRRNSVVSIMQIDQMISDDRMNMEDYGYSELRDGFFDALFLRPTPLAPGEVEEHAKATLPREFDKSHPLSPKEFLPRQLHELKSLVRRVTTTRSGIRLLKSFLGFFIAYVLCLIPAVRNWLGRYDYVMVISTILNHPARTFGSQVDGAVFTIIGTAAGLAWGVIGLLLSTSTLSASTGYGGILTMFLALFMASIAYIRSFFIRFYQSVLCAGMAVSFTTLAQSNAQTIEWPKIRSYAIPWLLGQAIAMVVNIVVFPDAGGRPLAIALDKSFRTMQESLVIPRPRDTRLRRRLGKTFLDMSLAYRDMRIDITITRFRPTDVRDLRNLVQGVVRALLSMETETVLFDDRIADNPIEITVSNPAGPSSESQAYCKDDPASVIDEGDISRKVAKTLSGPTKEVLACMTEGMKRCHAALMDLSGYRSHFGPPPEVSSDLTPVQMRITKALDTFGAAETSILTSGDLPDSYTDQSETVELFVFARHVRETAATIVNLMVKVHDMHLNSDRKRLNLPTYPPWKAVYRTNAQVRHDRGGVTAGMYQATFAEIAYLLESIKSREHNPEPREDYDAVAAEKIDSQLPTMDASMGSEPATKRDKLGHKVWMVLHRLQGFESRYALKVAILTSLLSIPAWLIGGTDWWNHYEAWWAVCMGWIMMHPRVGGNVQDLVTRAFAAILGAVWAGAAYAAGNGNPYVMAVFATIYMLPMLYRFTQSSHPRSGLVGCFSFTVISLGLQNHAGASSAALLAAHKGLVFLVGTTAPVIVNWILWPFVARHELRTALSSMLFFMSIIYRSVVAKYVYFDEGKDPTPEDVRRSEMLESRLREGFVRVRQLLVMTRHELRLRAPFDPLPYSALAGACERFFEYLIAVRQSALFYNPNYIRDNPVAAKKLLSYRRDAVAAILGNLYILAGALRSQRKVPRYLPSAAAARKKLLIKGAEVATEMANSPEYNNLERQKSWADIYSYSYNESLTGCVATLEELEKFTKLIVGEQAFDGHFKDNDSSDEECDTPSGQR
ncbi:Fc.00g060620.m01.CDS01 [Cosmosporella sp. VM-42]